MPDVDVWLYIASNSTFIGAYTSDDDALDEAMRQDDPAPWVELVTVQGPVRGSGAAQTPEKRTDARSPHRHQNTPQTGAQGREETA